MEFIKYHGLGNDYLVLHDYKHFTSNIDLTPKQVQRICDRNYGLGSDGILIGKKIYLVAISTLEYSILMVLKLKRVEMDCEFLHDIYGI